MRRVRWSDVPDGERSKHPYRDSAIFYGALGVILVVIAALTGGDVGEAVAVGAGFFVLATAYSWWRWRSRR